MAAVAVVALLVGSGLGFGLAGSITPRGSAGVNFVGFGFLPTRGWNVMQSGILDRGRVARAIAANVRIDPSDDLGGVPRRTIESMPPRGVLIVVTFRPRGDPAEDLMFPVRESPLRLADAGRIPSDAASGRVARYRLRAGLRGYNVDLRIYFGVAEPSASAVAAATQQVSRVVVGAERVTLFARPRVLGSPGTGAATLFGSVDNGRAGEAVTIQVKECGRDFFRVAGGAITEEGGSWSAPFWTGITATVRAVWKDAASGQITIRHRAIVSLEKRRSGGGFTAFVKSRTSVWRKKVQIQAFDRRLGTWRTVKTVVLSESGAAGVFRWASADFTVSVPKRTAIRAVMPLSQARPCYLAGVSRSLRT